MNPVSTTSRQLMLGRVVTLAGSIGAIVSGVRGSMTDGGWSGWPLLVYLLIMLTGLAVMVMARRRPRKS